jgi:hypothetical protein
LHKDYFRAIVAAALLLILPLRAIAADDDSKGSAGLELDLSKRYLSLAANGTADIDRKLLSSIAASYTNTSTGDPGDQVKAWEAELSLDKDIAAFSGGLAFEFSSDNQGRSGIGGKLNLAGTWNYSEHHAATLSLSGGPTRFSAAQVSSPTAKTQAQRVTVEDSEAITQWNPSSELALAFFDGLFTASGTLSRFRYQNYRLGSGLAGSGDQEDAAASVNNVLISGFIDWEWNVSAGVKFPWAISLDGIYTESLSEETHAWTKSLEWNLSKDIGKKFSMMLGAIHATENGSGENTYKTSATLNF